MIRRLRGLVDAHVAHATREISRDKNEITVQLGLARNLLFVDLEGRWMRNARMSNFPRVLQLRRPVVERRRQSVMQGIVRLEVEVAGDDGRSRTQIGMEW